jgi:3-hydroxyacyl-CoA dehydrogenase
MDIITTSVKERIALIEINNPPVNASSQAVRKGLLDAIVAADMNHNINAIVIACAGKTFVAGGDIKEFGKPPLEPHLPDLVNRIEACNKPVVAAWHGTALGGGCEIGLACHARVMTADAKLGLPEVKLGLVPGAGGTQRLPRLISILPAFDLVSTGRMVNAAEALKLGLCDEIAEGDLRQAAIAKAKAMIGKPLRRTGELVAAPISDEMMEVELKKITAKARGQIAPVTAAKLVRLASVTPLLDGMKEERAAFMRLIDSPQSKALRYAFFAEREVSKRPDLTLGTARTIHQIGVIGAGTMGAGIAVAFADAGFDVTVIETTEAALQKGRERIEGLYQRSLTSGRITAEIKAKRLAHFSYSSLLSSLAKADLVIEAVFEDMTVKLDLLKRLEAVVKPDCVIATNTSYLDVNAMGAALKNPSNLVGLHFFSPANVMRLLEIVNAQKTSPDVLTTAIDVGRRLKKIAVVSGVCDGFIGNRILSKYRAQCEYMLEEGALPQEIDSALESYGFAMGPFAVQDLAGLDISWARRKSLASTRNPSDRYVPLGDHLCELGRFGQKTGAGWYRYIDGKRVVDPMVEEMVRAHAKATGYPQKNFTPDEIISRVLEAMASEGQKILDEKITARPLDIDMVFIHGYGFPVHRGGPMYAAAEAGRV